jgi:hypothetical protein
MILDYSEYVELAYEESDGCISYWPSEADVRRVAPQFIEASEAPENLLGVTQAEQTLAIDRWMCFVLMRQGTFGEWYHLSHCPHCRAAVDHSTHPSHLPGDLLRAVEVRRCLACGWWDFEEEAKVRQDHDTPHYEAPSVHRRSVLRHFDIAGNDIPMQSLREYLARHPNALSTISPYALEKLVGDVFRETMDCEAIHIGGPNDGGIDLILVQGDRRFVVQAKRRAGTAAESVSSVREFIGAMVVADEVRGIFVTTAPRFSVPAVATAAAVVNRGVFEQIELVNADRLIDVCRLAVRDADEYWEKARSPLSELDIHINPGFSAFMELFMGQPDWKMAASDEGREESKRHASLRYFTFG